MSEIVQFKNISKSFNKVQALSNVSMSINSGEVHSIVGENGAGKSTLMNILGGLFEPTTGEIFIDGKQKVLTSEQDALKLGIGVVYQELKLCPNLNLTENIFLGRELRQGRRINWKEMHRRSEEVLKSLGIYISPTTLVKHLSVAQQQIIEIAKSLSKKIKVLVLDEPTSALTITESLMLFENIRKLRDSGVAIIYISHRLEEVLDLSDRISVLRDGKYKGTFNKKDVDINDLVRLIAGAKFSQELETSAQTKKPSRPVGDPYLKIINLSSADGTVKNVSFELFKGEVLGVYGIQGAGRTEMLETLFGLRKKISGTIQLNGVEVKNINPQMAIKNGFAMIPEDRKHIGILPNMNICENIITSCSEKITNCIGWMKKKEMNFIANKFKNDIGIKAINVMQNICNLSGGNQQKVLISRWLSTDPKVFLVDELTRGVDVGAKVEIFEILRTLRDKGLGIVLVSSELQEVLVESSRVLVMKNGNIVKELVGEDITKDNIVEQALVGENICEVVL